MPNGAAARNVKLVFAKNNVDESVKSRQEQKKNETYACPICDTKSNLDGSLAFTAFFKFFQSYAIVRFSSKLR